MNGTNKREKMSFVEIMAEQQREKDEKERFQDDIDFQNDLMFEYEVVDDDFEYALKLQHEMNMELENANEENSNNFTGEDDGNIDGNNTYDADLAYALKLQREEQRRYDEEVSYKRKLYEGGSKVSVVTPEQFHYHKSPHMYPVPKIRHHHSTQTTSEELSSSPLSDIHPDMMQDGFIDRLEIGTGLESIFLQGNFSPEEYSDLDEFLDEGTRHGRRRSRGNSLSISDDSDENIDEKNFIQTYGGNGANRRRKQRLKSDLRDPKSGRILTKHDPELASRMNAIEMAQYEGAGEIGSDILIPHFAYNSLKRDLHRFRVKHVNYGKDREANRMREENRELARTTEFGNIDNFTREILQKMRRKGVIQVINNFFKKGRESLLYHGNSNNQNNENEVAIKIFKTNIRDLNHLQTELKNNNKKRLNKQDRRKLYRLRTQIEMKNLQVAKRAGIRCPEPIEFKDHVLLLEFIGSNGVPAPELSEVKLGPQRWNRCYIEVLGLILKLYHSAHLIHCDLNEYNILYHNNECWLIGFGSCIGTTDINAEHSLKQDINKINQFFSSKHISNLIPVDTFYDFIVQFTSDQIPNMINSDNENTKENNEDNNKESNSDNNEEIVNSTPIKLDTNNEGIDEESQNSPENDEEIHKQINYKKSSRISKKQRKREMRKQRKEKKKKKRQAKALHQKRYYQQWENRVVQDLLTTIM